MKNLQVAPQPVLPAVEVSKEKVLYNSVFNILSYFLKIAIMVWLQPYLLHRISTEEYSLYPVVMSVMVFVFLIKTILTGSIARSVTEAYVQGDQERIKQITSTMFLVQITVGLAVLLFGLPVSWLVDRILTIDPRLLRDAQLMMGLMMGSFALQLAFVPFTVGFYVKQRFGVLNVINVSVNLLQILFLFLLLFGVSTRMLWVVVASEAANLLGLLVRILVSRYLVRSLKFSGAAVNWKIAPELLSFGFWNFLLQAAVQLQANASYLILNKASSALAVTNFHLGAFFYRKTDEALSVLTQPMIPALTTIMARGEQRRLSSAFVRFGRYYTWLFLLIAVPLMIYSRQVMGLYVGERYLAAATVLCLMFASVLSDLGNAMLIMLAIATGEIRATSIRVVLLQLINSALALYLVAVLKMGALGAAGATMAVQLIGRPLLLLPLGLRLAQVSPKRWLRDSFLPGYLPGLGAACLLLPLRFLKPPESWQRLAVYCILGAVVYLLIIFLFARRRGDIEDLKSVVLGLLGRAKK